MSDDVDDALEFLVELDQLTANGLVDVRPGHDGAPRFKPTAKARDEQEQFELSAPEELPDYVRRDE